MSSPEELLEKYGIEGPMGVRCLPASVWLRAGSSAVVHTAAGTSGRWRTVSLPGLRIQWVGGNDDASLPGDADLPRNGDAPGSDDLQRRGEVGPARLLGEGEWRLVPDFEARPVPDRAIAMGLLYPVDAGAITAVANATEAFFAQGVPTYVPDAFFVPQPPAYLPLHVRQAWEYGWHQLSALCRGTWPNDLREAVEEFTRQGVRIYWALEWTLMRVGPSPEFDQVGHAEAGEIVQRIFRA
jgi:hypothetical protein